MHVVIDGERGDGCAVIPLQIILAPSLAVALVDEELTGFGDRTVHAPFFANMIRAVEGSSTIGRDDSLSRSLAAYLDSPTINNRTDDDKTLVLAVRR